MKDFAPENLGQSRARACNKLAMHEHLTDLRAELVDCGILNPDDGSISDPRRIINMDEIPQVLNNRANLGNAKERVRGECSPTKGVPAIRRRSHMQHC